MMRGVAAADQHLRDVVVSFFWRCFPLDLDERRKHGIEDDDAVLHFAPETLGPGAPFATSLHAAFALPDDVTLSNCTVGEALQRILVHWDRRSFDPEMLVLRDEEEIAAEDDDDCADEFDPEEGGDGDE
jgi:hypothetical protein